MNWPPNKAWTSTFLRIGFRHFVAINYGGKGDGRWVNLVSVLDGQARLRIAWSEMKDTSMWRSGWLQLPRDEANPPSVKGSSRIHSNDRALDSLTCLHPSEDSRLSTFDNTCIERDWFPPEDLNNIQ